MCVGVWHRLAIFTPCNRGSSRQMAPARGLGFEVVFEGQGLPELLDGSFHRNSFYAVSQGLAWSPWTSCLGISFDFPYSMVGQHCQTRAAAINWTFLMSRLTGLVGHAESGDME